MPIYQANLILEILKDEDFYKISKAIFIAQVYRYISNPNKGSTPSELFQRFSIHSYSSYPYRPYRIKKLILQWIMKRKKDKVLAF